MKNVQITLDEETLLKVDAAGKSLGLNRYEIVRRALREWSTGMPSKHSSENGSTLYKESRTKQNGLTEGGRVPIVADGNEYNICLFDPHRGALVVKFIEEPGRIVREFASWQQYLAYALLEIADSGFPPEELVDLGHRRWGSSTFKLVALLEEMESLPDRAIDKRCEQFIEECSA
jgi:Ribbon-helix-helix protein, copG family